MLSPIVGVRAANSAGLNRRRAALSVEENQVR
jgi:hypothetical protein